MNFIGYNRLQFGTNQIKWKLWTVLKDLVIFCFRKTESFFLFEFKNTRHMCESSLSKNISFLIKIVCFGKNQRNQITLYFRPHGKQKVTSQNEAESRINCTKESYYKSNFLDYLCTHTHTPTKPGSFLFLVFDRFCVRFVVILRQESWWTSSK